MYESQRVQLPNGRGLWSAQSGPYPLAQGVQKVLVRLRGARREA